MPYIDLGKVHSRIRLYDMIPGVIRDASKVRKNYSFAISLSDQNEPPILCNVVTVTAYSNNGEPLSGALIPEPIFEPVNNFMLAKTNTATSATSDVYWKQVGWVSDRPDGQVPEGQPQPFTSVKSKYMVDTLPSMDKTAVTRNLQKWISQPESVLPTHYSTEDYSSQPITYDGSGYKKQENRKGTEATAGGEDQSDSGQGTGTANKGAATVTDDGVVETSNSYFVRQVEAAPGVWWGLETVSPFKDKGYPFWVVIRPDAINLPKDSQASSFVSIILCEDNVEAMTGNQSECVGYVELVIGSDGRVLLNYTINARSVDKKILQTGEAKQVSGSAPVTNEGDANSTRKAAKDNTSRVMSVNAPWLAEALANNQEIRVGFMSLMGRLCIYTSADRNTTVTMVGTNDTMLPFNLKTPKLSIYGYACKASVLACAMTFKKRAWMTLPDMQLSDAKGHKYPKNDGGGLRSGDCMDGRIISRGNDDTGALSAKQKGKSGKIYGAVFREYMEVDFTADEGVGKTRQRDTKLTIQETNYDTGMINPWGKVHIVHNPAVAGVHGGKPFWFVYLETDELSSQAYTPSGRAISANGSVQNLSRGNSGFPAFYTMSAFKPQAIQDEDREVVLSNRYLDVTQDVVSFACNYQLDSPRPTMVEYSGSLRLFNNEGVYSEFLSKARGIRVWLKWSTEETVEFLDSDMVYSGIAFGREGSQAPGEEYITFELADHWKVLEGIPIRNSPYYDGLFLGTVVEDLCGRAGMSFSDDVDVSHGKDGGPLYQFLGSALAYDKPLFRFSAETPLKECIVNVMRAFEMYLHIDHKGVVHMAPVPGGFTFDHEHSSWDPNPYDTYYLQIDQDEAPHRLILDGLNMVSTLSSSVYNSFMAMTIDRGTGRPIFVSQGYAKGLTDPNAMGYLGFIKEKRYDRPDLGNEAVAQRWLQGLVRAHTRPGFEVDFNTIGHNTAFRPGQYILLKKSVDDEGNPDVDFFKKKFRVTKVGHEYQASRNEWKTSIGAYQITPPSDNFKPTQGLLSETPTNPNDEP